MIFCELDCSPLWVPAGSVSVCLQSLHGIDELAVWRRYEAFRTLRESDGWDALPEARKRAVEGELRDFVLGGVAAGGPRQVLFACFLHSNRV